MANYKKFIFVSNAGGTVDSNAYASEAEKFAYIKSQAESSTGKWYKSIIFREATGEIYNRGKVFGVSAELGKEITDLKTLQSVLVTNGLVTESGDKGSKAYVWALAADKVSYDKTDDKVIASATDVKAAIKELDAAINDINDANLTYKTVRLTAEEVAALNDENVKEAYKTVKVDVEGTETQVGDTIKIFKDSSLVSIDFVDSKPAGEEGGQATSGQFLKYVYTLATGANETVYVDMSRLIEQSEVENGIQNVGGKLSVKIDANTEKDSAEIPGAFLTVGADGVKVSGIKDEITRKINALDLAADATNAIAKDTKEYVQTTISETDGIVKNEGVAVIYGTYGNDESEATNGIATVEDTKAYIDSQISGNTLEKVEGSTYIDVTDKANNKQTVSAVTAEYSATTHAFINDGLVDNTTLAAYFEDPANDWYEF